MQIFNATLLAHHGDRLRLIPRPWWATGNAAMDQDLPSLCSPPLLPLYAIWRADGDIPYAAKRGVPGPRFPIELSSIRQNFALNEFRTVRERDSFFGDTVLISTCLASRSFCL